MNKYQQGHADGMCGLYAILNFLQSKRSYWGEEPTKTLWYLLEGCRQFGWLPPQYLTDGFEDFQLKAVLDLQISNYRMPFQTFYTNDVIKAKDMTFNDYANAILSKNGAVIASWDARDHWVLIANRNNEPSIIDSASLNEAVVPFKGSRRVFGDVCGFAILPQKRRDVEIDL